MKITRADLHVGLDFWLWAIDNPGKEKKDWPRYEELEKYLARCPLCNLYATSKCLGCSLNINGLTCFSGDSAFYAWDGRDKTDEEKSEAASEIAAAYVKELEKLFDVELDGEEPIKQENEVKNGRDESL